MFQHFGEVAKQGHVSMNVVAYISAINPNKISINHQKRYHKRGCQNSGNHQIFIRINGRNFHGVYLFRDFHRTQFGTNSRSYFSGTNQGGNYRGNFPDYGQGNHAGQPRFGTEFQQCGPGLNSQHQTHYKSSDGY